MRLYCVCLLNKQGWNELHIKCSEPTAAKVRNAKAGQWYHVPSTRAHDFGVLDAGKCYVVECDDAWVDQREDQVKFNIIRLAGNVSVTEYHKPVDALSEKE